MLEIRSDHAFHDGGLPQIDHGDSPSQPRHGAEPVRRIAGFVIHVSPDSPQDRKEILTGKIHGASYPVPEEAQKLRPDLPQSLVYSLHKIRVEIAGYQSQ